MDTSSSDPVGTGWQRKGERSVVQQSEDSAGIVHQNPYAKVIAEKIKINGFKTAIRLAISSDSKERSSQLMFEMANSFVFQQPSGNSFLCDVLFYGKEAGW